jgi:hypothetical protein
MDLLRRGRANPFELDADLRHRAPGRGPQEVRHRAVSARQCEQRPQIVRVGDPLQSRSLLAQPVGVGCSCLRVGDRPCHLDDLADRRDREPRTEEVGD